MKGNEAWKVYVRGPHGVDEATDDAIVRRNQAFVS